MRLARMVMVVLAVCSTPSCALMRDACIETAAARASAAVLVSDAQTRVADAERVVDVLPGEARVRASEALAHVRVALDDARRVLASVDDACAAFDARDVFAAFRDAWLVLEPWLALLAGPHGGTSVARPIVVGAS